MFYYAMLMRHVATAQFIIVMTDEARNEVYAISAAQSKYPGYVVDKVKPVTRDTYDAFIVMSNNGSIPNAVH